MWCSTSTVLGPLNLCMYKYPFVSILGHRGIDYHIYAGDTQLYITFDLSDPTIVLDNINLCISEWECSVFFNFFIMDENDALSEYHKIPLGHNRTNGALYSKIYFKVEVCSAH